MKKISFSALCRDVSFNWVDVDGNIAISVNDLTPRNVEAVRKLGFKLKDEYQNISLSEAMFWDRKVYAMVFEPREGFIYDPKA